MRQYIRKADIILLIVLVAAGLLASAALAVHGGSHAASDSKVVIKSGGEVFGSYPLSEDAEIIVPAAPGVSYKDPHSEESVKGQGSVPLVYYNVVHIKGGEASVSAASCKNQVCVRHGSISHAGESIVCLPNRLIVSIEGADADSGEGGGYDSITS